ncbi:MAG TPA: glycosyltransferase family 2 protein [Polyangiaceae bacterium]|jgi:glycosyltransferase involved in cell wall biosynthesis
MSRRLLSIVVPAYNEEKYIGALLERIPKVDTEAVGFDKEILVVDDGSTDGTAAIVREHPAARLLQQRNQGKGKAVHHGVAEARGEYVLVQDADLEYFPEDYPAMLAAIEGPRDVVYGSRTLGQWRERTQLWPGLPGKHPRQTMGPYAAGLVLSGLTMLLYGRLVTDTLTAYKVYPRRALTSFDVKTHGFETDHELTAKLIRAGYRIREVPVRYEPRSVAAGKKIRASDGLKAIWTLARFRISD